MAPLSSKQKTSNRSCSTLNVCIGKRFALIRFQGTLRCQDSSPNQALASRSTHITATNHVGNVHENNCLFFVRKVFVKVFKKQFLPPKGGPPRHSRTGWFPRNFWPPKCQFHSRKRQFKLKLSHGVIIVETKSSNRSCSTFNLHWDFLCIGKRFLH